MSSRINLLTRFLKTAITQNRTSTTITTTASSESFQKLKEAVKENGNLLAENKKLLVDNENLRVRNYELKRLREIGTKDLNFSRQIFLCCHNKHKYNACTSLKIIISPNNHTHSNQSLHTKLYYTRNTKRRSRLITVNMEAVAETHNDLLNLLNEKNVALTETKAEAAQSANAVDKIIEENLQLKAENERLQVEIKELRIKLWDATEKDRKTNAGCLHEVLKVL
ncbi:hypothetical protein KCU78_g6313, partial [Aureobasidium melanogenum]